MCKTIGGSTGASWGRTKNGSVVAPPLDEVDDAARVLDPVFMHVQDSR
jgi:hypothetical protein